MNTLKISIIASSYSGVYRQLRERGFYITLGAPKKISKNEFIIKVIV